MFNEPDILNAALRRAADLEGGTVSSLTQRILRDWLVSHAFLPPPSVEVAGPVRIMPERDAQALVAKLRRARDRS